MSINISKKARSPLANILKNDPTAVAVLKQNELVEATYIGKTNKAAFFDLGRRGTGIIYGLELINAQGTIKELAQGGTTLAKVVEVENDEGYAELSLKETHKQKAWEEMKELKDSEETIEIKMNLANSGGLVGDINNLKAFLPVSQLSPENYPQVSEGDRSKIQEELEKLVGETLKVKVIDVNSRANKLIISEKALTTENIKAKLVNYKEGAVIDGIITGVADFGVFMKFANDPDIEGLIHISELDHRLIENPKEIIKINDVVKAKIVEIKDGRVSLSLKALKENPWDEVEKNYKAGQDISGKVNRFNPFGAFISLDQDIQGLIHVSEFGSVEEMKNQLKVGEEYNFTIELIKPEEKRIFLKLKK